MGVCYGANLTEEERKNNNRCKREPPVCLIKNRIGMESREELGVRKDSCYAFDFNDSCTEVVYNYNPHKAGLCPLFCENKEELLKKISKLTQAGLEGKL